MKLLTIVLAAAGHDSRAGIALAQGAAMVAASSGGTAETLVLGTDAAAAQTLSAGLSGTVHHATSTALREGSTDAIVGAATAAVLAVDPDVVLFAANAAENEAGARLAGRLHTALASDCVGLSIDNGQPTFVRPVFGGKAHAEVRVNARPAVATVGAGALPAPLAASSGASLRELSVSADPPARVVSLGVVGDEGGSRLTDARVIVSGGRGIGGPEGFARLAELAGALGGAVAASRFAVDSGWVPSSFQVGQTGVSVTPDVYIAIGISGASQHLVGIVGAKRVVAVNTDESAAIFENADLGTVDDWNELFPPLVSEVRRLRGQVP
jgi:electron transfer flavoprotein alpha subunit